MTWQLWSVSNPSRRLINWAFIMVVASWSELERFRRKESRRKKTLTLEINNKLFILSVQFSCSVMSDSLQPHESQLARLPCPSPAPRVYPNSCPLSQWCHPTISSSVFPFSSFNLSQHQGLFKWVSSLVFVMNIQDWFPLGWTGWISLLSKGLSRVLSNTTVQKHEFFGAQLSL